ncbi:hypothetical protein GCM10007385_32820 [Tateyamaria omphalii]|nr:hypothetical protein GCM10007385_32820 [Tateyamaria omphalii]
MFPVSGLQPEREILGFHSFRGLAEIARDDRICFTKVNPSNRVSGIWGNA